MSGAKQLAFRLRDVLGSAAARLWGTDASGKRGREYTAAEVRTLLDVYTTSETETLVSGTIEAVIGAAPEALDTLAELAAALNDDADFAASVTTALAGKAATVHTHAISDVTGLQTAIDGKQATLVSGTNIKTINSTSLLGIGDIVVSASPAGSSGQVQFNSAGSFGGAAGVVYATTGTNLTVAAQGSTIVACATVGAASQTAPLHEYRNNSGAVLVAVEGIVSNTHGRIRIRSNGSDNLNLSTFGTDAYIDCAAGSTIFRTSGSTRTNLTLFNSGSRGALFGQPVQFASIDDASASNSTLYFSTTQSKLVFKDASGTVNNLY